MKHLTPTKLTLALVTALSLTACSSIEPRPFTELELAEQGRADLNTAQADVARCRSIRRWLARSSTTSTAVRE